MRRTMWMATAVLGVAAATLASVGTAAAGGAAPPKATGTVQLAPMQWASFNAFPATTSAPVKGSVTYTNFDAPAASDVYRLASTVPIIFELGGTFPHTLTITTEKMLGYNTLAFAGNGVFDADHAYTFAATGTIVGTHVTMQVVYTGVGAGNTWNLTGVVAPDGSIAGPVTSPTGSSADGTWSSPAGTAHSVLSYTTPVTCATVSGTAATFGFTIPQWAIPVTVDVQDLGTPGTNGDKWAHGVGTCGDPTSPYQIIGGNLVVH